MGEAVNIASLVALGLGGFFYLVGAIGLNRMPDLFTRMHAVSVGDTLGVGLLILGMALHSGAGLLTVKLVIVLVMLWTTGAVATHALARAALHDGTQPVLLAADGRLVRQDVTALFPELGPRLSQPSTSELVEAGETAEHMQPDAGSARGEVLDAELHPAVKAMTGMVFSAAKIGMLGVLSAIRSGRMGAKPNHSTKGRRH